MNKNAILLAALVLLSTPVLGAIDDVSMNNLPSETTIEEGISIEGSSSGDNLDEIKIRVRDSGSSIWTTHSRKNCEGLSACSIETDNNYSPENTGEKEISIYVNDESDNGAHTETQTVNFVEQTDSIDEITLNDLPNEENTDTQISIDASATGNNLDNLKIRYREENSDWQTLEEKNCDNSDACSIDSEYETSTEQEVDFKAVISAGEESSTTNTQSVSFVENDNSQVDEVTMNDLPNTHETDSSLTIEGSTTGTNIDKLEILVKDGSSWETWKDKDCNNSNACSIDEDYETSQEEDVSFKVRSHAGDDQKTTDSQEVSFSEPEDGPTVTDVTMNDLPNQQITGDHMEIEASTTGRLLETLLVKERVDDGWETYYHKDCQEESACSIDITTYERNDEVDVDFKAVAIAGEGSNEDTEETDVQTVSFVDDYDLEADFDYSPSHPDEDETVTFESESTGDIEEWTWDFGDGDTAEGETVEHEFDNPGEYAVELEVDDGQNTDDETRIVEVGQETGACNIEVEDLQVNPENIQAGDDSTVSVTVDNDGDAQDIEVTFEVNDYVEEVENDVLSSGETEEYSITINPDHDVDLRATVETDSGSDNPCGYNRWDRTGFLNVYEAGENDATFNFDVEDEDGDEIENVRIRGVNGETFTRHTDHDGEASAHIESGTYDITASKPGYETEHKTRTVNSGETENVDFRLERREEGEDEGELSVLTEDLDENRIEDVEITAENGDDKTEYTDEDGRAYFYLEEGDYTVTAEKDGYLDQARDIEIDAGERTPVLFEMVDEDEDSIRITDLEYDDTVCRGDTLTVTVSIRNSRDSDELVTFRGEGLGSSSERYVVTERGDTITRELRFTNVEGSGSEDFTAFIDNSVHDEKTGEVTVEDCGHKQTSQTATGLTAQVNPKTAQVGEAINVKGFVDGTRGSAEVEINSNRNTVARTSTDRSGYYSTYIRFNSPGTKDLDIESGGITRSRTVEVLASATVGGITGPQQVFASEEFELCADISSQVDASVVLLRNGEVMESKNGNGEVCFETEAGEPGTAIYEVRALTSGSGGSSTKSIEVLEQGNEVESFPDQLASVESGGSIARVELYNTNDDLKTYNLQLTGIDEKWYSQSDDTVKLRSGEREMVYFYLTPRAEGDYRPTLRVDSDGSTLYDNTIILETEGTTKPQQKSFVKRLLQLFGF